MEQITKRPRVPRRRIGAGPLIAGALLAGLIPSVAWAQPVTPLGMVGGDSRMFTGDLPNSDWENGSWKAECGDPTPVITGVAMYASYGIFDYWNTNMILCASPAYISSLFSVNQLSGYTLNTVWGDDRMDTSTGDWAIGWIKLECGEHDVMTGIAQTPNFQRADLTAARCSAGNFHAATNCVPVWPGSGPCCTDHRENPTYGNDWDHGFPKLQCGEGRYVKGVAAYPDLGQQEPGPDRFVEAILCCTPSF
jgi:hypothetical protein